MNGCFPQNLNVLFLCCTQKDFMNYKTCWKLITNISWNKVWNKIDLWYGYFYKLLFFFPKSALHHGYFYRKSACFSVTCFCGSVESPLASVEYLYELCFWIWSFLSVMIDDIKVYNNCTTNKSVTVSWTINETFPIGVKHFIYIRNVKTGNLIELSKVRFTAFILSLKNLLVKRYEKR